MNNGNKRASFRQSSAKVLTAVESTKNDTFVELFQHFNALVVTIFLAAACVAMYLGESNTAICLLAVASLPLIARIFHVQQATYRAERFSADLAPIHKEQAVLARRTTQITIALLTSLAFVALFADFEQHTTLLYAITFAVAVVPGGLLAIASQSVSQLNRWTRTKLRIAMRCVMTDVSTKVTIVLISLVSQVLFHIPMAIAAIQLLVLGAILLAAPLTTLHWDPDSDDKTYRIFSLKSLRAIVGCGLLSAALAYVTFVFFFWQRGLSPVRIDPTSQLYAQATTVTLLTLILCQFVNVFMLRADKHDKLFAPHLWSNAKLLIAIAISIGLLANIIYNPWINAFFNSGSLSLIDVCSAVVAAGLYTIFRLIQRHSRRHTRHALFRDHDHETLRKHPKLA